MNHGPITREKLMQLAEIDTDALDEKLFPGVKPGEIRTYSGLHIDPFNPDVGSISLIDISHALSNSCRYGGHCPRFYSVAEHSCFVADLMELDGRPIEYLRVGLLHDAEEAYLTDIPTPIKRQMPEYTARGDHLREQIFRRFSLEPGLYASIKPYDTDAYELERKFLWTKEYVPLTPEVAKQQFLNRCVEYGIGPTKV